jgi:hypothetical protein
MGDAGEGLIDADSRIQERMEELERAKADRQVAPTKNPELIAELESLRLARAELDAQLRTTTHERRREQLTAAIAEVERRTEEARKKLVGD